MEYGFLKPSMIHGGCTKKELLKSIGEGKIWLEKSITEEEKKDKRMVWALIKNVLDPEGDQILSRVPKIDEKNFEEIAGLMDTSCLERNPLIVQRLSS